MVLQKAAMTTCTSGVPSALHGLETEINQNMERSATCRDNSELITLSNHIWLSNPGTENSPIAHLQPSPFLVGERLIVLKDNKQL